MQAPGPQVAAPAPGPEAMMVDNAVVVEVVKRSPVVFQGLVDFSKYEMEDKKYMETMTEAVLTKIDTCWTVLCQTAIKVARIASPDLVLLSAPMAETVENLVPEIGACFSYEQRGNEAPGMTTKHLKKADGTLIKVTFSKINLKAALNRDLKAAGLNPNDGATRSAMHIGLQANAAQWSRIRDAINAEEGGSVCPDANFVRLGRSGGAAIRANAAANGGHNVAIDSIYNSISTGRNWKARNVSDDLKMNDQDTLAQALGAASSKVSTYTRRIVNMGFRSCVKLMLDIPVKTTLHEYVQDLKIRSVREPLKSLQLPITPPWVMAVIDLSGNVKVSGLHALINLNAGITKLKDNFPGGADRARLCVIEVTWSAYQDLSTIKKILGDETLVPGCIKEWGLSGLMGSYKNNAGAVPDTVRAKEMPPLLLESNTKVWSQQYNQIFEPNLGIQHKSLDYANSDAYAYRSAPNITYEEAKKYMKEDCAQPRLGLWITITGAVSRAVESTAPFGGLSFTPEVRLKYELQRKAKKTEAEARIGSAAVVNDGGITVALAQAEQDSSKARVSEVYKSNPKKMIIDNMRAQNKLKFAGQLRKRKYVKS